jgi:hypothetical protein
MLFALLISSVVTGSAAMLSQCAPLLTASNRAYTAARRGALSLAGLLSQEIAFDGQAKIVSGEASHKIMNDLMKSGVTSLWTAAKKCAIFKQLDVGLNLRLKTKEGGDNFRNFVPINVCRSPPA